MAQAHHFLPPPGPAVDPWPRRPAPEFLFQSLVVRDPHSRIGGFTRGLGTSIAVHLVLAALIVIVPIVAYDALPEPGTAIRAFFVPPPTVAPAPPPPPPPAPASAARMARPTVAQPPPVEATAFVAPIEVPAEIKPEASLDLSAGIEGGVPGGVEGGVPGGVVGGVVGGAFAGPPVTATKAVRVGGAIIAPQLLKKVPPEFPDLAAQARVGGIVIVEALVDIHGVVKTATVLRGHVLLDAAAVAAVQQWRYRPLLLNGVPTDFIVVVTVKFNLDQR